MIAPPPLSDNEVHIFCRSLDDEVARYVSPDELLRADRLLDPEKRRRFITGRSLLREVLGRYLAKPPHEIAFTTGVHGKPFLSTAVHKNPPHFNLSHSGNVFLLAIAADREVGIDVEEMNSDIPFPEIARLTFTPREQGELFALPDYQQRPFFYRIWTRKEAYLKACGAGFSNPGAIETPRSPVSSSAPHGQEPWHIREITVPNTCCASLAVKGAPPLIRYPG
jgi:4'-phosphopantetheinyl transferase